MKFKISLLLFLFYSQFILCQVIQWSPDRKLDFKDFTNTIHEEDNSIGAESFIGIDFKIVSNSIWTGRIKIKTFAVFHPEKSWFNKKYLSDNNVLNHEQKHFDIAHAFANKLQGIVDHKIKGTNDFNDNFQKLYDENFREYLEFQSKYDLDTKHGENVEQQNKYNEIVSKLIRDGFNEEKQ